MTGANKPNPEINYLARDFASFRRLMVDYITMHVPDWTEQNPADLGNVLVEVLAYAADYMSYYQDAIATEAYLGTARQRRSVRRHVRLLDYHLHEGCNARAWVHIEVREDTTLPRGTQLLTQYSDTETATVIQPDSPDYYSALAQGAKIFETMHDIDLWAAHNEITIAVSNGEACALPAGATRVEVEYPQANPHQLKVGDVLVFEEILNPITGQDAGVDRNRRHVVRLVSVERADHSDVIKIVWDPQDALPFDMTVAAYLGGTYVDDMTVVRGNMVLADHGQTIWAEKLPRVPMSVSARYRPMLRYRALTYAVPYDPHNPLPASQAVIQDPHQAYPVIELYEGQEPVRGAAERNGAESDLFGQFGIALSEDFKRRPIRDGVTQVTDSATGHRFLVVREEDGAQNIYRDKQWFVQRELLSGGPFERNYAVEMEDDGRAFLRFGFSGLSQRPIPGTHFAATYRIGNGSEVNIGPDTIVHIVSDTPTVRKVRNPLASTGGVDPETLQHARVCAPQAYRTQERCVTESDYAEIARRHPEVADAAAQLRWTGSWHTACIYVIRRGGQEIDPPFKATLLRFMEPFRLLGFEIDILPPQYVPVRIEFRVFPRPGYSPEQVKVALHKAFFNSRRSDGPLGFFFAEYASFGQPIYLSQVVDQAMQVPGVARVDVTCFKRKTEDRTPQVVDQIDAGPLEVIRVEPDDMLFFDPEN
jgi:hypothetical protein